MSLSPIFAEFGPKYAAKGLHVFPCLRGGKEPLTKHGFKDASIDPEQIALWCKQYPEANIGIATGASGLVVLDVDVKDGAPGDASFADLLKEIPGLNQTLMARTWSGGRHYYYSARQSCVVASSQGSLAAGLDVRGNTGYVLAPPSIVGDVAYRWEQRDERIEVPMELVTKCEVEKWNASPPKNRAEGEKYGPGERYGFLWKTACSLRAKGGTESAIRAFLEVQNNELCDPPCAPERIDDAVRGAISYPPGEIMEHYRSTEAARKAKPKVKYKLTRYDNVKEENVEWLLPGYFPNGKFSLAWGMEGECKSYTTVGIASMLSRGEALPGVTFPMGAEPKSTLLLTYEDDPNDTIKPRLIRCGADMSKVYTVDYRDGLVSAKEMASFEEMVEEIPDLGLVVIDPLTEFARGIDDNNEGAIRAAINPLIQLAFKKKFAIIGVKHANKNSEAAIKDRTAGGRAWTALARSAVLIGHDNRKENGEWETFGGMFPTKGNLGGRTPGLLLRIKDGHFEFMGFDPTLKTDHLFPRKKDKEES